VNSFHVLLPNTFKRLDFSHASSGIPPAVICISSFCHANAGVRAIKDEFLLVFYLKALEA
jgi:hypothetical protein